MSRKKCSCTQICPRISGNTKMLSFNLSLPKEKRCSKPFACDQGSQGQGERKRSMFFTGQLKVIRSGHEAESWVECQNCEQRTQPNGKRARFLVFLAARSCRCGLHQKQVLVHSSAKEHPCRGFLGQEADLFLRLIVPKESAIALQRIG